MEGHNVSIEYRFAEGRYDALPAMAADLVRRQVTVIAAISGTPAALSAKPATDTIPIVFAIGGDPVCPWSCHQSQPSNRKYHRREFLHGPACNEATRDFASLGTSGANNRHFGDPANPPSALEARQVPDAARGFGLRAQVFFASTAKEIDNAFAAIVQQRIIALYVSADPLFFNNRFKVVSLMTNGGIVAIYADREIAEAVMSALVPADRRRIARPDST